MSADFAVDPLRAIWEELANVEAELHAERMQMRRAFDANDAIAARVGRLRDRILPALDEAPRVYIAGPMRGYEEFNYPAFNRAAERFRALGHTVVNPVEVNHGAADPGDYPPEHYVRNDLREMVAGCDAIALLPGWEASVGARCEVAVALTLAFAFYDAGSGTRREPPSQCVISGGYDAKVAAPYTLDELAAQALAWQSVTFTERTVFSIAAHLRKEARELVGTDEEPARLFYPEEFADVFLLLVALADAWHVTLSRAVHDKLQINRSRTWGKPDAQGVVEHIAEGAT